MTYWDTSALVKLYVAEPESASIERLGANRAPFHSSILVLAEMLCTLRRKEAAGDIAAGTATKLFDEFKADCAQNRIVILPFGRDIVATAEQMAHLAYGQKPPVLLRSLDLIHVATAMAAGAKALVATDKRLREMASLAGLVVLP